MAQRTERTAQASRRTPRSSLGPRQPSDPVRDGLMANGLSNCPEGSRIMAWKSEFDFPRSCNRAATRRSRQKLDHARSRCPARRYCSRPPRDLEQCPGCFYHVRGVLDVTWGPPDLALLASRVLGLIVALQRVWRDRKGRSPCASDHQCPLLATSLRQRGPASRPVEGSLRLCSRLCR